VINQAVELGADALLVHHGFFWRGEDPRMVGIKKQRVATLLQHNVNLLAYHLPLDCHVDIGNNACLGRLLEVDAVAVHDANRISNLLWTGELKRALLADELASVIETCLQRKPQSIGGNSKPIRRIAWCTGAAQDLIEEAKRLGADAYISGEISERTYYQAQELGIHYFACGHHATERYGVQALGNLLSQKYGFSHHYIESPNLI
jgi:dinuclear metal center YbgI/SA1388 family protein